MFVFNEADILNPKSPTGPLVDAYLLVDLLLSDGGSDLDRRAIIKDVRANLERAFLCMGVLGNEEVFSD